MVKDKFMDMDVHKVDKIVKNNHRFISPFKDISSYFIVAQSDINETIIQLFWE